jgi:hypothetical protein
MFFEKPVMAKIAVGRDWPLKRRFLPDEPKKSNRVKPNPT